MRLVALLLLVSASINSLNDTLDDFRKHYGFSSYTQCKDYEKIFKCLTACKSINFEIFRMTHDCKCTCHEMKTTTIYPYFMWRTNGTTRKLPPTYSPSLYHIVGTLSPATIVFSDEEGDKGNATTTESSSGGSGNVTSGGGGDSNSTGGGGSEANPGESPAGPVAAS